MWPVKTFPDPSNFVHISIECSQLSPVWHFSWSPVAFATALMSSQLCLLYLPCQTFNISHTQVSQPLLWTLEIERSYGKADQSPALPKIWLIFTSRCWTLFHKTYTASRVILDAHIKGDPGWQSPGNKSPWEQYEVNFGPDWSLESINWAIIASQPRFEVPLDPGVWGNYVCSTGFWNGLHRAELFFDCIYNLWIKDSMFCWIK